MSVYHLIRDGEIVASRDFALGDDVPSLAPNKGAWLPEEAGDLALDAATEVSLGEVLTVEPERVVRALQRRPKTADEVAAMRAHKISAIKAEASRRILAEYPTWKQANMTARGVELIRISGERDWTSDETAEAGLLQAAWDGIKAIRSRSDELEASVPDDASGISAFDETQGWSA